MLSRKIDVFNGDADGICALHQLRLVEPEISELVTGPKREIDLLKRVEAQTGDQITVLDIALSKNREDVDRLLQQGAHIRYFDHHQSGIIPRHPKFVSYIDMDSRVCTSLLVDQYLQGKQRIWAVIAAFGDNLAVSAQLAAQTLNLSVEELTQLQSLGECLNYNGYGETLADLFFDPAELYRQLHAYTDPFSFIHESAAYLVLKTGYAEDMSLAINLDPIEASPVGRVYSLPAQKWARRISGVFGNRLAIESPTQAHAVLTGKAEGGYVVSVRAPTVTSLGADEVCSQFETGGGRRGAAGINHLPESELNRFMTVFYTTFSRSS